MKLCQVVPPLLLLLGLGLARATTPAPHGSTSGLAGSFPTSLPGLWNVSYQDVVVATVELLNSRGISPYVLRLQELQPQPGWLRDLRSHQDLSFTLEETTCRAPGTATAACQSRWWGGVTRCQGSVFLEEQQPMVQLSCEKVPIVLGGTRRSHLKGLLSRIRSGLGRFFQCGKIWIRDKLHLDRPQP